MVTAASYALCAVAASLLRGRGDDCRSTLMVSTLMTAFCTHELDWHKPVTGTSVLRVSWHAVLASPQAKITAALALAVGAAGAQVTVPLTVGQCRDIVVGTESLAQGFMRGDIKPEGATGPLLALIELFEDAGFRQHLAGSIGGT